MKNYKKRLLTFLTAGAMFAAMMPSMTTSAMLEWHSTTWGDYELVDDCGMFSWVGGQYLIGVGMTGYGYEQLYVITPYMQQFYFFVDEAANTEENNALIADILEQYYAPSRAINDESPDDWSGWYKAYDRLQNGTLWYTVYDTTTNEQAAERAESVYAALSQTGTISAFYGCGEVAMVQPMHAYSGIASYFKTDVNAEMLTALEAYLEERSLNYEIQENSNYYRVMPDETLSKKEELILAADICQTLGLKPALCVVEETDQTAYATALPGTLSQGDLNRSGQISIADAVLYTQVLSDSASLCESAAAVADFDGDGMLAATDLSKLLLYLGGTISYEEL